MMGSILWVSRANLCTGRGTVLWTNTQSPREPSPDLRFLYPGAVQKKNFRPRRKITTKGAEKIVPHSAL